MFPQNQDSGRAGVGILDAVVEKRQEFSSQSSELTTSVRPHAVPRGWEGFSTAPEYVF